MKYICLAITFIVFSLPSFGANWKNIENTDFYVDLDSVDRHGDIVSAKLSSKEVVVMDCKRKLFFRESQWVPISQYENSEVIYGMICKQKWQFWK